MVLSHKGYSWLCQKLGSNTGSARCRSKSSKVSKARGLPNPPTCSDSVFSVPPRLPDPTSISCMLPFCGVFLLEFFFRSFLLIHAASCHSCLTSGHTTPELLEGDHWKSTTCLGPTLLSRVISHRIIPTTSLNRPRLKYGCLPLSVIFGSWSGLTQGLCSQVCPQRSNQFFLICRYQVQQSWFLNPLC